MMVGCSQPAAMINPIRQCDAAVLLWAVVEAIEDVPTTPEAQREFEHGRSALSELLGRWTSEGQQHDSPSGWPSEDAAIIVELTATRNHGQEWSCHDLIRLHKLAGALPPSTISARLGRTVQSVRSKASAEGISLKIQNEEAASECFKGGCR